MNIVVLAKKDFGNSAFQMVQAVRKMTDHRIHLVVAQHGNYEDGQQYYDHCIADHEFPLLTKPESNRSVQEVISERKRIIVKIKKDLSAVQKLINEADIIHWKGDWLPGDHFTRYLSIPLHKTIVSVSGSGFRRRGKARHHTAQLAWFSIDEYVKKSDFRTAFTPDLNYPEFKGVYTQQAIDSTSQPYLWKNSARPVIAHSPSNRCKKGTDIFLKAIAELRNSRFEFDVDIIENVTKQECVERKKKATIFFDQVGVGFYGNAALEAMQFGIPTIAGIPDSSVKQSSGKLTRQNCPVITIKPTVESMVTAIERLLCPPLFCPKMETVSQKTKEFCDGFHSYEAVGTMWDEIYKEVV